MQSKTAQLLKSRLRKNFGDDYGTQWSDALLEKIIIEAQREYAVYTGCLVGKFSVISALSPVQNLPEDFFRIIRILDNTGQEIPVISFRKLADMYEDFRSIRGSQAKSVCFNFDGFGKFRLFPVLPENTFVGTAIYSRLPHDNLLEVKNIYAVEQHALFQMYQFTGKKQAQICYSAFIDQVNRDISENHASGNKHISRTGVYF